VRRRRRKKKKKKKKRAYTENGEIINGKHKYSYQTVIPVCLEVFTCALRNISGLRKIREMTK
jgi:hypothetical protein